MPDLDTLQQALNRAIERHNMAMFTPVGQARELAAVTLRLATEAIRRWRHPARRRDLGSGPARIPRRLRGDRLRLHRSCPRPARPMAIRARCRRSRGPGQADPPARRALDRRTRSRRQPHPARKGRAFASLDSLIARQGGQHVLYGSALALAAALQAWSRHARTPLIDLARTVIR